MSQREAGCVLGYGTGAAVSVQLKRLRQQLDEDKSILRKVARIERKLARRYTGMTLAQLGEQMGGIDYAAIGVGLHRFEKRLDKDRELKRICAEAIRMFDV